MIARLSAVLAAVPALFGLIGFLTLAPAAAHAQGPQVATPTVPLGVVIEKDAMFVDAVKGSVFGTTQAPTITTPREDANGWPLTDFSMIVRDDTFLRSQDPAPPSYAGFAGTYHLSFLGKATVTPFFTTPAATVPNQTVPVIQNQVYNPVTNTTTADVVVPQPVAGGDVVLDLQFSNTSGNTFLNHTEHPAGGLINVKLISPGYDPNTTQVFTDAYLSELKDFGLMRCMDLQQTNGDLTTRNWADRPLPTAAVQAPVSVEYLVQLANQSHKDLWLNVPINATGDYVTGLANFLKNGETLGGVFYPGIDPSLHVYLEYSNEVWNSGFQQFAANAANAAADPDPNLTANLNVTDPYKTSDAFGGNAHRVQVREYAKHVGQFSQTFASVFGAQAINTQIRPLLAWQFGNGDFPEMMAFLALEFGVPPSQLISGIAEAPYFYVDNSFADTLDHLFPALDADIDSYAPPLTQLRAYATFYGVKGLSYEGGFGMTGTVNIGNIMLANHGLKPDPSNAGAYLPDGRMQDTLLRYFNTWFGSGLDTFTYFNLSGGWSQYGWWGLTEDPFAPTIKNSAVHAAVTSPAPAVTVGTPLPAPGASLTQPAYAFTDDDYNRFGSAGPTLAIYNPAAGDLSRNDYLLRAPSAGDYRVVLNVAQAQANATLPVVPGRTTTLDVLLDNHLLGTLTLADGASTAPLKVTLPAGLHTLRLTNAQFTEPTVSDHGTGNCPYLTLNSLVIDNVTPATDVTSLVGLRFSGLRFDRAHGLFHQTATLTNTGAAALAGPLYLVLDGLTPGVGLSDSAGKTADTSPTGSPYVSSASGLAPNASVSLDLAFYNPHRYALAYTPRVLAGPGAP